MTGFGAGGPLTNPMDKPADDRLIDARLGAAPGGTADPVRILAIPGSLRAGSLNRSLLLAARDLAPVGVVVELVDLRPIPFYDGDVEAAGDPEPVHDLKARLRAADALLLATPEYNGTIPGVLQNAIDWLSRPRGASALAGKPVGIVTATPSPRGGARVQAHLAAVLTSAGAAPLAGGTVLVREASGALAADGAVADPVVRDRLRALVAALADTADGLSPGADAVVGVRRASAGIPTAAGR